MIEYFQTNLWLMWILVGIFFLILELTSGDFFFMSFVLGAVAATLVALCGTGLVPQLLAWILISIAFLLFVRPFALRYLHRNDKNISTNIDALIGREGRVEEAIAPGESGYVAVDGDVWKAVSRETDVIEVGEKVKIVDRKSLIVTVERI
ncbi:MAG: NfeD family protein [Bacteroidales bacterium]|nr:NfeD family protein [Bacteroidales bacterium]MDY5360670.1 NfeD family protein [Sodaliphilus sp.]